MSAVEERGAVRAPLYRKLKPGPSSSPDRVVANQRARLCGAMIELTAECGYRRVTVRELSRLAAVSTKTFYNCFANVEDCFNATYARIVGQLLARAATAPRDGENQLRRLVSEAFTFLAEDRKTAQFVLIDSVSVGAASSPRVKGTTVALERLVNAEIARSTGAAPVSAALVHGAVGAGMRVARARILPVDDSSEDDLVDRFADWVGRLLEDELPEGAGARLEEHAVESSTRTAVRNPDDRRFLMVAAARLAGQDGYAQMTASAIRREAGVSRRAFDQHFTDVDDCFVSAMESLLADVADSAMRLARGASTWDAAVVHTVAGLCEWLKRNPVEARLAIIDITAPGLVGLERREAIVGRWADQFRRTAPAAIRPDTLVAESSVAAAWCLTKRHLTLVETGRFEPLFPSLCFVLLAPVVGARRAETAISAGVR